MGVAEKIVVTMKLVAENGLASVAVSEESEGIESVDLTPTVAGAAPISAGIDEPTTVYAALGKYGTPLELFSKSAEVLLSEWMSVLAVVLQGNYTEKVRLNAQGEGVRVKARLGDHPYSYSALYSAPEGPWLDVSYQPYGAPDAIAPLLRAMEAILREQ